MLVASGQGRIGELTQLGHDLRTPLTIINGYAQMLKSNELSTEQRARACELILEKCQELNGLIRAFLELRESELEPIAPVEQTAYTRRERRIRGALPTLEDAGGGQRERRMTELGHRLLPLKEVANDLLQIGVVTDVFGGAPARDHEGDVVVRLHVLEGQVRVPTVPRLLCVRVITGLEVMDHKVQLLLTRRGDLHLIALLLQTLVWIEDFERLRCVARDHQDFWR